MQQTPGLFYNKAIFFCIVAIVFSACFQNIKQENTALKGQLQLADSLAFMNKGDSALHLLMKLRPQLKSDDPLISTYYCLKAEHYLFEPAKMSLYADSALAFFADEEKIDQYPNEYFKALLTKGDASLRAKKYISSLNYYYKAKKILPYNDCDNGDLANKLGMIYYAQGNFGLAGKYWAESYDRLMQCPEKINNQKLFFAEQGSLNNAGFSYERDGDLDSASYYYRIDVKVIDKADSANSAAKNFITSSRMVVYDNLGGLYFKKGDLKLALNYLTKCLAMPVSNQDGIRIAPLLKLAELYMQTGDYKKAGDAFNQSKLLLDRFYRENSESQIKWNKLYAQYLFKLNNTAGAYKYLDTYIHLRDSAYNSRADLYRIDVEGEFNAIQQQQVMAGLQAQNKLRAVYATAITIIVALFVLIFFLIVRNLKKSQKNTKETTAKNKQLQQTLSELELVNQNYIRVMRVMAHDLKNPLSGITGIVSAVLEENELSDENKYMLKLIETTGNNSMVMIDELLTSGLADANEPVIKQQTDIKALLYDSVELLRFKAGEKQQELLFEHDYTPVIANINPEKMWRVFNNIIVNAIKFSPVGGTIIVHIELDKNIIISVADNGIGIPGDQKNNVFEMFTSAKRIGTNGEKPFGLGLSISKKIIEIHNGRIWFENKPTGGTIFYIELPGMAVK